MSNARRGQAERTFDAFVGAKILRARKARGLSGAKLARILGVSRDRLYWIETGGRCSLFMAVEIAAALGVRLAELVPDKISSDVGFNQKNPRFVRGPAFHRLG